MFHLVARGFHFISVSVCGNPMVFLFLHCADASVSRQVFCRLFLFLFCVLFCFCMFALLDRGHRRRRAHSARRRQRHQRGASARSLSACRGSGLAFLDRCCLGGRLWAQGSCRLCWQCRLSFYFFILVCRAGPGGRRCARGRLGRRRQRAAVPGVLGRLLALSAPPPLPRVRPRVLRRLLKHTHAAQDHQAAVARVVARITVGVADHDRRSAERRRGEWWQWSEADAPSTQQCEQ